MLFLRLCRIKIDFLARMRLRRKVVFVGDLFLLLCRSQHALIEAIKRANTKEGQEEEEEKGIEVHIQLTLFEPAVTIRRQL